MNKISKLFDVKFLKFVAVGVLNTIVGWTIMMVAYNILHLGFWVSTAANYIITSVMSFFLNKYFTFKSNGKLWVEAIRFAANIAVCYLLAYGIAQPLTGMLVGKAPEVFFDFFKNILPTVFTSNQTVIDNVAMLVGMGLFVMFNYFGQRFFAFKKRNG